VETSGFVGQQIFLDTAAQCGVVLFDVKHYDDEKHRAGTGVSNAPILKNLRAAARSPFWEKILPRIPVIPGFNDSAADARGFAGLLREAGFFRAQLLPFHQMGEQKYKELKRDYFFKGVRQLHREDLEAYRNVFISEGIDCFF